MVARIVWAALAELRRSMSRTFEYVTTGRKRCLTRCTVQILAVFFTLSAFFVGRVLFVYVFPLRRVVGSHQRGAVGPLPSEVFLRVVKEYFKGLFSKVDTLGNTGTEPYCFGHTRVCTRLTPIPGTRVCARLPPE